MHLPQDDRERRIAEFIERYGRHVEQSGGPGMASRIVALLLVCEDPILSSGEITEALQTSSGTVSTNTRLLEHLGWIERVRVPGRRGAFFRVRPHAIERLFGDMVGNISRTREILEHVAEVLPEGRRDRIDEVLEFHAFLEEEMPGLLSRWYARRKDDGARKTG